MSNLDIVIRAIESKGLKVSRHNSGCLSPCPDRPDNHPSLLFGEDNAGGVWFKDQAGKSTTESILTALNLGREVLRGENGHTPRNGHNGHGPKPNKPAPSPKPAAPPLDWSSPDAIYEYLNEQGQPHYRILRKNFVRSDGTRDKEFRQQHWAGDFWEWGRGKTRPVPYRLSELTAADSDTWICLCEGEKDADNLAGYGMVATALAGGAANTKDLAALLPYATRRKWAIFQHFDAPGEKWATEAAQLLATVASEVKVITPAIGGWKDHEHQDPSDYIAWAVNQGFDIPKAFQIMIDRAPIWQAPAEESKELSYTFEPISLADLLKRPDKEWLIKDFLGRGDIAMVYGAPGSGKTFVVIDLLFSAVLGKTFADKFAIERPLRVAYAAGEGVGGLRSRFAAAANRYQAYQNPNLANLSIFLDAPQLFTDTLETTIFQFVKDWQDRQAGQLDILVIDTLHSAIFGADENAAKDIGVVLQAAKFARDSLGCTVLLVHHANKTGAYRGSSALHGAMDSMIETKYESESNAGTVECFKQKDAEHFSKRPFKLAGDSVSGSAFVEWGDIVVMDDSSKPNARQRARLKIINLLREKPILNQSQIIEALEVGKNSILEALEEMEAEGTVMVQIGTKGAKFYQLKMSDF